MYCTISYWICFYNLIYSKCLSRSTFISTEVAIHSFGIWQTLKFNISWLPPQSKICFYSLVPLQASVWLKYFINNNWDNTKSVLHWKPGSKVWKKGSMLAFEFTSGSETDLPLQKTDGYKHKWHIKMLEGCFTCALCLTCLTITFESQR